MFKKHVALMMMFIILIVVVWNNTFSSKKPISNANACQEYNELHMVSKLHINALYQSKPCLDQTIAIVFDSSQVDVFLKIMELK